MTTLNKTTLLLLGIALAYIVPSVFSGETYHVTLTPAGYVPKDLRLLKGSLVTFQTTTGKEFWPASDPHPTHDLYPEFDPKEAVQPDKQWSFRFDRTGTWRYHDHLEPLFTGTVIVDGPPNVVAQQELFISFLNMVLSRIGRIRSRLESFLPSGSDESLSTYCENHHQTEDTYVLCWSDIFRKEVTAHGVDASLALLARLREKNLAFAENCHVAAHAIGESAYTLIRQGKLEKLTHDPSVCNFGYYHGLMQEYVSHGKDLNAAKKYCEAQASRARPGGETDESVVQCFHGIGHGIVYWFASKGKPAEPEISAYGIARCRNMLDPKTTVFGECVNGVYGGIAAFYFTLHGFTYEMRKYDPFWFCKKEPAEYRKYCYDELVPPVYLLSGFDIRKAGRFITELPDSEAKNIAMEHLGWMPSHRGLIEKGTYKEVIEACHSFGDPLDKRCLSGLAKSLISTGDLFGAIERTGTVCTHTLLSEDEKNACFLSAKTQLQFTYGGQKETYFCEQITSLFHWRCPTTKQ